MSTMCVLEHSGEEHSRQGSAELKMQDDLGTPPAQLVVVTQHYTELHSKQEWILLQSSRRQLCFNP